MDVRVVLVDLQLLLELRNCFVVFVLVHQYESQVVVGVRLLG